MVQPGRQEASQSENRVRQLACDCSQQLQEHSPFKAEKKRCFCLFLLGSYYPRGSPDPNPHHHPQSFRPSIARAQRPAGLGPRRAALPCGILPWRLPNLVGFLPAFPSGETPERLKKSGRPLARLSRSKLSSHSPRATSLPRKRKEEAK